MPAEDEHKVNMRVTVKSYGHKDKVIIGTIASLTRLLHRSFGNRVEVTYIDDEGGEHPVRRDPTIKVSGFREVAGHSLITVGDR